ncbi:hypothetical protein SBI_06613 [Streptomyces bingchenggensis BCW-1]|uniref:Uncharacterized protein n=1 Tax=Streptomyces bingchenggensis (strain BCW-1) TaxID=749414 RepID=D7BW04_STRBB|nr:hypothetical protein SBI_06613 [Streptomyces bingchenggensis BCW-1]
MNSQHGPIANFTNEWEIRSFPHQALERGLPRAVLLVQLLIFPPYGVDASLKEWRSYE